METLSPLGPNNPIHDHLDEVIELNQPAIEEQTPVDQSNEVPPPPPPLPLSPGLMEKIWAIVVKIFKAVGNWIAAVFIFLFCWKKHTEMTEEQKKEAERIANLAKTKIEQANEEMALASKEKSIEGTIKHLENSIDFHESAQAYLQLAFAYHELNDNQDSELLEREKTYLKLAIDLGYNDPKFVNDYLLFASGWKVSKEIEAEMIKEGESHYEADRFDNAIDIFKKVLALKNDENSLYCLSFSYFNTEKTVKAIDTFVKYIETKRFRLGYSDLVKMEFIEDTKIAHNVDTKGAYAYAFYLCYKDGKGFVPDENKAEYWLEQSKELGFKVEVYETETSSSDIVTSDEDTSTSSVSSEETKPVIGLDPNQFVGIDPKLKEIMDAILVQFKLPNPIWNEEYKAWEIPLEKPVAYSRSAYFESDDGYPSNYFFGKGLDEVNCASNKRAYYEDLKTEKLLFSFDPATQKISFLSGFYIYLNPVSNYHIFNKVISYQFTDKGIEVITQLRYPHKNIGTAWGAISRTESSLKKHAQKLIINGKENYDYYKDITNDDSQWEITMLREQETLLKVYQDENLFYPYDYPF